jgi:hypothetical protein
MENLREFDRAYAEASGDWADYVMRYGEASEQVIKPVPRLVMHHAKPTKRRCAYISVKSAVRSESPSWHRPRPLHWGTPHSHSYRG